MQDDEKETNAVNRTPYTPFAERCARRHRRTLLTMVAAVLLVTGTVPFLASMAAALPHCPDGSPPPCDLPDPDPGPDDPPPPPPDDPEPPPAPEPECDAPGGFARPVGIVPPGYIYSPTAFGGVVADPQPDDTFAADAAGHAPYVGRLRTRVANGREEFLVCAHVGTNTPVDALTPFPLTGTGGHAATIAPRVVVIDAAGNTAAYDLGTAGISGSISNYAGSTDVHEGFVQMWVPFTFGMREPGFTVRVEIRGTPSLPGGDTQVMGADEVFVHLGPAPQHMAGTVYQALGVALDDGAIAERPGDPGADDLSSYFGPAALPAITEAIEGLAPRDIEDGRLNTLEWWGGPPTLDIVDVTSDVSHLSLQLSGIATIQATVYPREWGIVAGSCEVSAALPVTATATFSLGFNPDHDRPRVIIHSLAASATINYLTATGEVWAAWDPFPLSCHNAVESHIRDRVIERIDELTSGLADNQEVKQALAGVNKMFDPADLTTGPLSSVDLDLPNGLGFTLQGGRYVATGPGDTVRIWHEGADLAADAVAWGQGGSRFVYSVVPRSSVSVVQSTHNRARANGQDFDIGLVINGATVNQVSRALTAGKPQSVIVAPPGDVNALAKLNPADKIDVGLLDLYDKVDVTDDGVPDLDIQVHPSVPPIYLPSPPIGWPAGGNVDLYVPSLRISIPTVSAVATMAADIRVGLDAFIDDNHVVPYIQAAHVAPRFLRLGRDINQTTDPTADPKGIVARATKDIREAVPAKVASILKAVHIPSLSAFGGPPVFLRNLSLQTVGDGHLGVYVDVATSPDPGTSPVSVTWFGGGPNGAPNVAVVVVSPTAIPGLGPYTINWTLKDATNGAVLYQSPGGGESYPPPASGPNPMFKTLAASQLSVSTDTCSGDHSVGLQYTLAITRGGYTKNVTSGMGYTWAGTPPNPLPSSCYEPDPEPEPEPEPDPDPPICLKQPWKCPGDF